MNIKRGAARIRKALQTSKAIRWSVIGVVALGIFGAGQSASDATGKIPDPRQMGGPGHMANISDLEGAWDGVGTMPDGTPFCLKDWPCEDTEWTPGK